MTKAQTLIAFALVLAAPARGQDAFESHWRDGQAELDGYRLVVSRYGQDRSGTAVMIFVTEPFSESKRVKDDRPPHNSRDTIDVLKLNLVRDFQTGVYDYNTMASVFVRASDFEPVKASFSSAEWCGHVYAEMIFRPKQIRGMYASYFEDESGPIVLERPKGGITEDQLFIALRGLRAEFLPAGEQRTVPYLPGLFFTRLSHQPLRWTQAVIKREAVQQSVTVPAGTFDAMLYDVRIGDGRTGQFFIEAAYPHRIVKWSLPPDVGGELTGSTRLPYWKLNSEGDESYLKEIGLGQ
ncbi:MAG TPA: hypothetical protein VEC56_05090 [Candidatus Krumholzibacteria bacterium]|nr:hypothetical protein [Candidatus Krumholzibacteria bacterium]